MATSTNIQYLVSSGKDEFGATTTVGAGTSNRRQIETFIAGGAITSGDWVMFETTTATGASRVLTVIQATLAATGRPLTVGVAIQTAASGETVDVVVGGYVEGANVATAVLVGQSLSISTTVNGRAEAGANTAIAPYCGVALEGAAANLCDVWVIKNF